MNMRKMATTERGGFTIIEVVLVLAIAGLIFLMVFLALPQLRRSQADSQRRNDAAKVFNAVAQYQVSEGGPLPPNGVAPAMPEDDAVIDSNTYVCGKRNGSTRNGANCLIREYLNGSGAAKNTLIDPTGWAYGLTIEDMQSGGEPKEMDDTDFDEHMIYVVKHAVCEGTSAIYSTNSRDYAVMMKLEGNGAFCRSNND